jgi:hypothetical protein
MEHFFIHLNGHASSKALNYIVAYTTQSDVEIPSQISSRCTHISGHGIDHQFKHTINYALHTHFSHTNQNWDPFPTLNNMQV